MLSLLSVKYSRYGNPRKKASDERSSVANAVSLKKKKKERRLKPHKTIVVNNKPIWLF